jgi:chromosomal replication initiation ATPase DnaA
MSGLEEEPDQFRFDLSTAPAMSRNDFVAGAANREALAWIDAWPDWPGRALLLWGPSGCGKSHLAAIWRDRAGGRVWRPGVDEANSATGRAAVVEDLTAGASEETLLHLFNLVSETGGWLLLTAAAPPARMSIVLPDLRSRLLAAPAVEIGLPDDELLAAVIEKLFSDRQIRPERDVVPFLLPRIERSYSGARDIVRRLDKAAMADRRKVSVSLARENLRDAEERAT